MKTITTLSIALGITIQSFAADYFWVGNSGNWSDLSHWATMSGGSVFHSQPPTQNDIVFFDVNSFSTTSQTVLIDVTANCKSLEWVGVSNSPTFDISEDLFISGSLTLDAGMNLTGLGTVRFTSPDPGNTITSAGLYLRNLSFQGTGDWSLQDHLNVSSISLQEGTLNTNNNDLSCGYFSADGDLTRQLNLGSSAVTCGYWDISNGSNLTIDPGTSSFLATSTFLGGGFTYYDFSSGEYPIYIYGSNTFHTLTLTAGSRVVIEEGSTQTVSDLQGTGDCANLIILESALEGTPITISQSSGTVNLDYVKLTDVTATGGAIFNATNGIDGGNNTGWTISARVGTTYYWVGNSGNWSDASHWSLSSNGTGGGCIPTQLDVIIFDAYSFSASGHAVTIDDLNANCLSMDWTGVTNTPDLAGTRDLDIYGSLTLVPAMTVSYGTVGIQSINFRSDSPGNTVNTAGHTLNADIHFSGAGEWTLMDDIVLNTQPGRFYLDEGSLITNGNAITATSIYSSTGLNRQLNLGNSVITATTQWNVFDETNLTLIPGTSTIIVGSSGTFYGANLTYYSVQMNSNQQINIDGSNTFHELSIPNSKTVNFTAGSTQTMDVLSVPAGSNCTAFTILRTTIAGFPATISMPSSTFNGDYLLISDVVANGNFNATNSIGVGDVSGWNITPLAGQNFYWIGGSGSWNDTQHWSLTSGGSPGSCLPSLLDAVFFDSNSFTAPGQLVNLNGTAYCKSMDWTGATFSPKLSGGNHLKINGWFTLIANMTVDYSGQITFLSPDAGNTITTGGQSLNSTINFDGAGEYSLQDDLETSGQINFNQGTLNTNNFNLTLGNGFQAYYPLTRNLNLGSSTVIVNNWVMADVPNLTFDAGTSEIICLTNGGGFTGGGLQYNDLTAAGPNAIYISGSNTFHNLNLEPGVILFLDTTTTQTVSRLTARGTQALNITLKTISDGTTATISQSTPNFCGDYLNIQDIVASGGAPFYAGANSSDLGNNIGWSFTDCVKPVADAGMNDSICLGESVTIGGSPTASGATGPYTYSWAPTDGLNDPALANPKASPDDTTTYIVTVTDALSALNTDTVTIVVKPLPPASASPDTTLCKGESIQLNSSGGVSYSWSPAATLNNSAISNPISTPLITTMYVVAVTDTYGCSATDSITVTVDPPVTANAGLDESICAGTSTILSGSGGVLYSWSPAAGLSDASLATPTAYPVASTEYILTAQSGVCSDTDTVVITVNSLPLAFAGSDASVCAQDTLVLQGAGTGGMEPYVFSWTPATLISDNTVDNPSVFPDVTTNYVLTVEDDNGCMGLDSLMVFVNPLPIVDAGVADTICALDVVTLGGSPTAGGGTPPYSYSWMPGLANDSTSANPSASTSVATTYTVMVTDFNKCMATDTVAVAVDTLAPGAGFIYSESAEGVIDFTDTSSNPLDWFWDFGDGNSSIDQNPSHTYANKGTYQVCLTAANACHEEDVCEMVAAIVTGISLPEQDSGIKIYPNPATDEFILTLDPVESGEVQIIIYNLIGTPIYSNTIYDTGSAASLSVETINWPSDLYLISIMNGNQRIVKRVVIH